MDEPTSWHAVAVAGDYETLVQAIDAKQFDPKTLLDKDGFTVWHFLAYGGHYESLIHAADSKLFDPNTTITRTGLTVWHILALKGYYNNIIHAIVNGRFDPQTLKTKKGFTVWHAMAQGKHYDKLTYAVKNALIDKNYLAFLQRLIKSGADGSEECRICLDSISFRLLSSEAPVQKDSIYRDELIRLLEIEATQHKIENFMLKKVATKLVAKIDSQSQEIESLKVCAASLQGSSTGYSLTPETAGQRPVSYLPLFAKRSATTITTSSSSAAPESVAKKARFGEL